MKKIYTIVALLLISFGFVNPLVSNFDVLAAQINSNFDITINSEKEIIDYQFDSHYLDVEVNYDADMTMFDKQMKITLPSNMQIRTLPFVDGETISNVSSEVDEEGNTNIFITIPASSNGMNRSFDFSVTFDSNSVSSNDFYTVTGEYYELDEEGNPDSNTPMTSEAYIQIYDYASNGSFSLKNYMTNSGFYTGAPIDMDLYFKREGSYAQTHDSYIDYEVQSFSVDLSKIKYTLPDGTSEYVGDNTKYIKFIQEDDNPYMPPYYTYDESSGLLTLNEDYDHIYNFKILFSSEFFVEGTEIDMNYEESIIMKMTEANGNDITSIFNFPEYNFTLQDTGYDIDLEVSSMIEDNTVLTDVEDGPLFEVELFNENNYLQDLSFDVEIPNGVEVSTIIGADRDRDYKIIDEQGNVITETITEGSNQSGLTLDEPLVGPQVITVEISNVDAGEAIANDIVGTSYKSIEFYGNVEGNVGDEIAYSLDNDSIIADVNDYYGTLIEEDVNFNNISSTDSDIVTIVDKTLVPVDAKSNIKIFEDGTENEITQVMPATSVDVQVEAFTNSQHESAVTDKYHDPLVYINVPAEILPAGGSFDKGDFTAAYDFDDITSQISEVSVVDTNVMLPNGEDSTLLVIKFEGTILEFDSQEGLNIKFNGIIDPGIIENREIIFKEKSIAFGSTNTEYYTDGPGYFSLTANEINTYGVDLSVGENVASLEVDNTFDVIVTESIKSQSLIDANNSGYFYTINENTPLEDFPEYRIGTEGTFKFVQQNTTNEDAQNLNSYFVLPQEENLAFILDSENIINDSDVNVYYTDEEITDKTQLISGNLDINWTSTLPTDGNVTAIRLESPTIAKHSIQQLVIPFTTKYLEVEDSVTYDSKTEGFTTYKLDDGVVNNGNRASVNILKSGTPILTTSVDDSYYFDDDGIIKSDIQDYEVSDDYSLEVNDINKDETIVMGHYFDGTSNSLTYDEFMNMTQYKGGKYSITYVTDKDADAQETVETNEFNLLMDALLDVKDSDVKIDDAPNTNEDIINNMVVSATDFDGSSLIESIDIDNLGGYDVENPAVGKYDITFSVEGTTNNIVTDTASLTITRDNSTIDPETPETEGVASIASINGIVDLTSAPRNREQLFELLEVNASEFDGTDITSDVNYNLGGYDLSDPEMGTYEITFDVTGDNGDNVKSLSTLTVTDESVDIETEGEITGNGENGGTTGENGILNTGVSYQITSIIIILIVILSVFFVKKKIK